MQEMKLRMKVKKEILSICRLPAGSPMPMWAFDGEFFSIVKTPDELSIVCEDEFIPKGIEKESPLKAIRIEGQLDFTLVGIIASISTILANEGISIFLLSTFNTDYILVREHQLDAAVKALGQAGHDIKR